MSTYENGSGTVPRLPARVVDTLIDSAGVSRCAPGSGITVTDQTKQVEQLVHDVCEELLARLPDAAGAAKHIHTWLKRQASAERDPVKRAVFVESANAALAIIEGRA